MSTVAGRQRRTSSTARLTWSPPPISPSGHARFSRHATPSAAAPARASASRSSAVPLLPSSPRVRSHKPTWCPRRTCLAMVPPTPIFDVVRVGPEREQIHRHVRTHTHATDRSLTSAPHSTGRRQGRPGPWQGVTNVTGSDTSVMARDKTVSTCVETVHARSAEGPGACLTSQVISICLQECQDDRTGLAATLRSLPIMTMSLRHRQTRHDNTGMSLLETLMTTLKGVRVTSWREIR